MDRTVHGRTRRAVLSALGVTGLTALAGCSDVFGTDPGADENGDSATPTDEPTPEPVTTDDSTPEPVTTDDAAPEPVTTDAGSTAADGR